MLHVLEGHVYRPVEQKDFSVDPHLRFECRCGEYTYSATMALQANQRAITRRIVVSLGSIILLGVLAVLVIPFFTRS